MDDEPIVLRVMQASLERHGFRVLTAAGAEEALSICCESPAIHAVVTDVDIERGRMNGLQLAVTLRAIRPSLLIVIVSGSLEAQRAAVQSAFPFLAKPFIPRDLAGMLDELQARAVTAG